MIQAAVVPHDQHVRRPLVAVYELWLRLMPEQLEQDLLRLVLGHAVDADRITWTHIERAAPGLGVWPRNRMKLRLQRTVAIADRHRAPLVSLAVHAVSRIASPR